MRAEGVLEEIKSRLDIVDIMSDYVVLKKTGQNYKGLCPFHSEKTPSMVVSPAKQIFHCFGCGAGGDIVGFVMKYENLSFGEAIKVLAKKAGVKLTAQSFGESGEKEAIRAVQKEALGFFSGQLALSKAALSYLKNRGISAESVKDFSLGYAPKAWHGLFERLKSKGFDEKLILKSGLVSPGQKGPYDNFRDRIIFPIFDGHGEAIAFGGRVMDSSMPKYLNSPDTPIFKKGDTLYALDRASEEIRKKGYALIVEGYLDAIMCHQAGFKNAVAPLGTALTQAHLKTLARYAPSVTLVFDGDRAGISAARRSVPIVFEHGMRTKVLLMPEGEDPDSLLRGKGGRERLEGLIEGAGTPVEFLLKTSEAGGAGKTEGVREALGIISKVSDGIFREELLIELSERSKVRELALREELKKLSAPQHSGWKAPLRGAKKQEAGLKTGLKEPPLKEELLLLSIMMSLPEKIPAITGAVTPGQIRNELVRTAIAAASAGHGPETLIREAGEEERALLRRLSFDQGFDPAEADRNIVDCVRKIRLRDVEDRIKEARASGDLKLLSGLLDERKDYHKGV